jgi:hypothetical protein
MLPSSIKTTIMNKRSSRQTAQTPDTSHPRDLRPSSARRLPTRYRQQNTSLSTSEKKKKSSKPKRHLGKPPGDEDSLCNANSDDTIVVATHPLSPTASMEYSYVEEGGGHDGEAMDMDWEMGMCELNSFFPNDSSDVTAGNVAPLSL